MILLRVWFTYTVAEWYRELKDIEASIVAEGAEEQELGQLSHQRLAEGGPVVGRVVDNRDAIIMGGRPSTCSVGEPLSTG